jgi:hypothetical protein
MTWVFNSSCGFENMILNDRNEDEDNIIPEGKGHKDTKIRWSRV